MSLKNFTQSQKLAILKSAASVGIKKAAEIVDPIKRSGSRPATGIPDFRPNPHGCFQLQSAPVLFSS